MSMPTRLRIFCFCLLFPICAAGQLDLRPVAHCPSNEIYDMLVDKKGFIWIAHNLGVSRYDGISFTSFTNPEQTAISMTDLVEDNYGRIWCHNFNGQIFYIQNDKMHYLKEYDFRTSTNFPGIILYGDELVATSNRGFFICNTATLQCRYEVKSGTEFPQGELCVVGNKVVASGCLTKWFIYEQGKGIYTSPLTDTILEENRSIQLQRRPCADTVLFVDRNRGLLIGEQIKDGKTVRVLEKQLHGNFNTSSVLEGNIWVNTSNGSFSLNKTDSIEGYDLTAMATDKEGNKWFGSLSKGLFVSYKASGWKLISPVYIDGTDYVKCIKKAGNELLTVSQAGKLASMAPANKNAFRFFGTIPPTSGTAVDIHLAYGKNYFIEASRGLYVINTETHAINFLEEESVKDIVLNGNLAYLALSYGVKVENIENWRLKAENNRTCPFSIPSRNLTKATRKSDRYDIFFLKKDYRCRAIAFDELSNSLLVSFTDGLQRVDDKGYTYITFKGARLYVSSMRHFGPKIYAGTFNDGLFAISGNKVSKITTGESDSSDAIVRIKRCNNHIWLFKAHGVQVLDPTSDTIVNNLYPFPTDASYITDVEEDSSNIYLATTQGFYSIPLSQSLVVERADPTLLYTLVNNVDTVYGNNIALASNKNNLLFRFAIPVYNNARQLHLRYSLFNGDTAAPGNEWYYTQDDQRDIQFNALKPGTYALEVLAVQNTETISSKPFIYHFTVQQPWFNTWWFYTFVLLATAALFFALYQYRLQQVVKIEQVRRKISVDLHDDIGSTLSSINVYSQLANVGKDNTEYIKAIQNNTVDIINSLDDLVWNINPKNDTIGQLLTRMQLFACPMLQENGIVCTFKTSTESKDLLISPDVRANIYLLFKEIINNALKHSGCSECSVTIIQKNKYLRLVIKDNGKGFNINSISRHRNGLNNMQQRAKDLKGNIIIESEPASGTEIRLDCKLR